MPIDKLNIKAKVVYVDLFGYDTLINNANCSKHERLIRDETEKLGYSKGAVYTEQSEPLVGKS
jgi:hypothetical protein